MEFIFKVEKHDSGGTKDSGAEVLYYFKLYELLYTGMDTKPYSQFKT
jgi:hypothetical protein